MVSWNYPYYDADEYRSNGGYLLWTNYIKKHSYYDVTGETPQQISQGIYKTIISIYNFLWFDISTFYWLNSGSSFTIYKPSSYQPEYGLSNNEFNYIYLQDRSVVSQTMTVESLDVVIGQIGGYTTLLWIVINFIFSGYENFKFTNSLISKVYACTPEGPEAPKA